MRRRVIPHDQWRKELDSFSRSHEGWIVRVTVTEPGGRSRVEARDLPLQGVSADVNSPQTIDVMVGERPDSHLTHQVMNPRALAFEQTEAGAISALVMRSGDGTETAVEFRSPMRSEDVDGLPVAFGQGKTTESFRRSHKEARMNLVLNPPLLVFIAGTRAALGFGLGLLLSSRIPDSRRRALGMTLVAIGAATTIPAAISVFRRREPSRLQLSTASSE